MLRTHAIASCSTTGASPSKQASQALLAKLAERGETKPSGRRWKIAVCGPHRSPQVELGPDFETSWDPQGADFAMMLVEFYCAKLDAPLLAEVVRDGVVLRSRLRHPRTVDFDAADPAGTLKREARDAPRFRL